jgi:hypothetical protein
MGQVLAGRYELEVPLGRGAAGEVWQGKDVAGGKHGKHIAVKLIDLAQVDPPVPGDTGTPLAESITRFRQEAGLIESLRHPNIADVLDAGRVGSQLFVALELAPGVALSGLMDERGARGMGLFPVSSVLRIAEQVCSGLAAAHRVGVVHHAIKPSNLMVTPSLGVKIIDFGVAALLADNAKRLAEPPQSATTIAYMSPEEAQGGEVDGRADLYSLGCVMYQLLAGRPPFVSTLPSALLMMQVMDQAPPLAEVRPDLPAEAFQLISDLMEKDAAARPSSAEEAIVRIQDLRRMFGDEVVEFEADRDTVETESPVGLRHADLGHTRFDAFAASATALEPAVLPELAVIPEPAVAREPAVAGMGVAASAGQSVLTPSRKAAFASELPVAPRPPKGDTGWMALKTPPAGQRPPLRTQPRGGVAPANPVPPRPRTPVSLPSQLVPAAPQHRRTGVWPGILVSLLVAALLGGGGVYYWMNVLDGMKISSFSISQGTKLTNCNGTEKLIGMFDTNGHSGTIEYQWVLNGVRQPVKEFHATGSNPKIELSWTLKNQTVGTDVAQLSVLKPHMDQSTLDMPYSCAAK